MVFFSLLKSNFVYCRLQLVNRDLQVAFANREKMLLERQQIAVSLALEMEEKLKPLMEVCYSSLLL